MSEVDMFFGAVKEKRNESVEYFLSEDFHQALANGIETPEVVVQKGIDQLISGVLDVVEEHHAEIITATIDDRDLVLITCTSGLSTLYFDEVSN